MTATFEISMTALQTATLLWAVAFFASFIGSETIFTLSGIPALMLSAVGLGGLLAASVLWVAKHVRITIV